MKYTAFCEALVLATLLTVSCSVLEDRMDCPCRVTVKTQTDSTCMVTFFDNDKKIVQRRTMSSSELTTPDNVTDVEKGDIHVNVLKGFDRLKFVSSHEVVYYEGEDAPEVYAWTKECRAREERVTVESTLQKEYAKFTIKCSDFYWPYDHVLHVNSTAFDLLTLSPQERPANIYKTSTEGVSQFNIVRQLSNDSFTLSLVNPDTMAPYAIFQLGDYLDQMGYSWDVDWLEDVTVEINYIRSQITITVNNWGEGKTFKYTI